MDTLDMVILDMVIDSCTARGRLRPILKPNPRPRLIPTTDMDTLVSDTDMVMVMVLDTVDSDMAMDLDTMAIMDLDTTVAYTARGLLMLSLRPRLILTTDMDIMVSDTDMGSDMGQ